MTIFVLAVCARVEAANRLVYGAVASFFKDAKIPEKYWNQSSPDYFLNDPKYQYIFEPIKVTVIPEIIALLCGMHHSLFDNLGTLSQLAGLPTELASLIADEEYRTKVFEKYGEIYTALKNPDSRELIWEFMKGKVTAEWDDVFSGNTTKGAYYAGYIVMETIIGVVTAGIGTSIKSAVVGSTTFKYAAEMVTVISGKVLERAPFIGKVAHWVKNKYTILKNGTNYVIKGIENGVIHDLNQAGQIVLKTADKLLPQPNNVPPGLVMAAIGPDGKVRTVMMIGDELYEAGKTLLEELKEALFAGVAQTPSALARSANEISDIRILLKPEIVAAIKKLDDAATGTAKREAFLQDILDTKNTPDGLGQNLGKLTPEMVEAWEKIAAKGHKKSRQNYKVLNNFTRLSTEVQGDLLRFTDDTFEDFTANVLDDAFMVLLNEKPEIAKAFVSHKVPAYLQYSDDVADNILEIGDTDLGRKVEAWTKRSQEVAAFRQRMVNAQAFANGITNKFTYQYRDLPNKFMREVTFDVVYQGKTYRTRFDGVIWDAEKEKYFALECKLGNAGLSKNQAAFLKALKHGGTIKPVGDNALKVFKSSEIGQDVRGLFQQGQWYKNELLIENDLLP